MAVSVLVIDDDPEFRQLVTRMLRALGFRVVGEADSVASGIAAAMALKPDAAMVDIGLPDGDGVTLARALMDLPWGLRVVLTSSDPDATSPDAVDASGARAFVAKHELPNAPLLELLSPA